MLEEIKHNAEGDTTLSLDELDAVSGGADKDWETEAAEICVQGGGFTWRILPLFLGKWEVRLLYLIGGQTQL